MGRSMITDDKAEKALDYMASTEDSCAKAKGRMKVADQLRKTAKAVAFLRHEGTGVVREQEAYASQEFIDAVKEIDDSTVDYEILNLRRKRAEWTIEMWRTQNANQRRGNI